MPQRIEIPGQGIIEFPDGMTDDQIATAIKANFGGKDSSSWKGYLPTVGNMGKAIGALRSSAESILEPAAAMASGMAAIVPAGIAGVAGDIYSGITGGPRIGEEVASDVMNALTYQPRSKGGQENAAAIAKAFNDSKLAGLPIGTFETRVASTLANPSLLQAEAAANAARQATAGKFIGGSKRLMGYALKPTEKEWRTGDAQKAIDTLLERGISPTEGGVEQLKGLINSLNQQIAEAISESPAQVKVSKVVKSLDSSRQKFLAQVNSTSDLAAIERAYSDFMRHPLLEGKENIPVQLAQELKVGTYKQLAKKYNGELGTADVEAQKSLARGLKEQIAKEVPGISELNAEDSALINALNIAEKRAFSEMSKNPLGLAVFAHNPATFTAFMADKSAAFKALMARAMYRAGKGIEPTSLPEPAVPSAPTSRRIPINQDIPYSGLPNIGSTVIPGSWREGLLPKQEPRGLPVLSEDLLPVVDRYVGTNIPIGRVEGGMFSSAKTPLPELPPQGRGLLSLADDTAQARPTQQRQPMDFPLRQEVLQQAQIANATQRFVAEAERLRSLIKESSGFWKQKYKDQLTALEKEFGAGMRQLGIDNPQEAIGLQKLYQGGEGTKLPVIKAQGLMR